MSNNLHMSDMTSARFVPAVTTILLETSCSHDLAKAGNDQESLGKKSRKDERKLKKSYQHSEKASVDILNYSSSDSSGNEINVNFQSGSKTYSSAGKRGLTNRKTATNQRKRPKRHDDYSSPVTGRLHSTSITSNSKKSHNIPRIFSTSFESSFTAESPSLRSLTPPTSTLLNFETKDDDDVTDNITWSDGDSEERKTSQAERGSPDVTSQDKIPLITQYVKQDQEKQVSGSIDDFDSDSDSCLEQLFAKGSSPSISLNTPTPTPTPCTPIKGEGQPPLDSTKKRKQKYLRCGLAERLHRLCIQENSRKSFWSHKIQEINRDDDEYPSTSDDVTLTLQVISENLDHGVYVIRCHVVSQDVVPLQTNHVIILLESERREHLDVNLTSRYLKIFSPWKILDLRDFSQPVLLCMAHCEVISSSCSNFMLEESPEFEEPPTEDIRSTLAKERTVITPCGSDIEKGKARNSQRKELPPGEEIVMDWDKQDSAGYQGICVASRINVTARVQRLFWRSEEIRDGSPNTASTLALSIVENSKTLKKNERMSLCCLVQGLSGVFFEVRFPEDILLHETSWQEVLFQSEGSVLVFSKLRLTERRKRKRRQLFGLIDSLKKTTNLKQTSERKSLNRSVRQESCFIFLYDGQSSLDRMPESEASDYPSYSSPENLNLNDLKSASIMAGCRMKIYGKLLHTNFTNDKYYNTKHVQLWLSGIFITGDSNVMAEPAVSVIQVRFSSNRTVEWTESTLLPGQLLCMQDVILEKAKPAIFTTDVFSKIQLIDPQSSRPGYNEESLNIYEFWRRTMSTTMTDEEYEVLKSSPVTRIPDLSQASMIDALVTFEGVIFDVDQENAFCSYSCSSCHSKDIAEVQHIISPRYHCNTCSLEFISPESNTHLEVYLKCTTTPALKLVKVKLCQQTIAGLLSGSNEDSGEGYDVKCVLNKYLGPMCCCVVEKVQDDSSKISFKLEELERNSWNK